jgi:hypothetical protein
MFGARGDYALIRLDECLGKAYGIAKFDNPDRKTSVPETVISTLSISRISPTKSAVFYEEKCMALPKTPVSGVFSQTCVTEDGMSGSPIFRTNDDGSYTIVGMTTGALVNQPRGGEPKTIVPYAIYASILTPFLTSALGKAPTLVSNEKARPTIRQTPIR